MQAFEYNDNTIATILMTCPPELICAIPAIKCTAYMLGIS
jgi:hypothetical protein